MSLPFDYSKLPLVARKTISGVAIIIPIYFFDIYLFHKQFYHTNPFWLSIVAAYLISISSLVSNYFTSILYHAIRKTQEKITEVVFNFAIEISLLSAVIFNCIVFFMEKKGVLQLGLELIFIHLFVCIGFFIVAFCGTKKPDKNK